MDGTIIDSTNAIVKHWHQIGKEIGVEPEVILATSHGRRSIDVLEILSPERANWECTCILLLQLPAFFPFFFLSMSLARLFHISIPSLDCLVLLLSHHLLLIRTSDRSYGPQTVDVFHTRRKIRTMSLIGYTCEQT